MSHDDLALAVITSTAVVPDLDQPDGWAEADRLRLLVGALRDAGYRIVGVLAADAALTDQLAALARRFSFDA